MKTLLFLVIASGLYLCLGFAEAGHNSGQYQYISPRPDAMYVSSGATIVVRPGAQIDPESVSVHLFHVTGTSSGVHSGKVTLAGDQKTIIFRPDQPFAPGETVDVILEPGIRTVSGLALEDFAYQFAVSPGGSGTEYSSGLYEERDEYGVESQALPAQSPSSDKKYVTVPDDFPTIQVNVPGNDTGDGYVFLAATGRGRGSTSVPYLLILDDAGEPVFYRRMTPGSPVLDFKKQPNGLLTYFDSTDRAFHALDDTYAIVDTYQAGNGYAAETDVHELLLLPDDHFLLMIYDFEQVDMSKIVANGVPTATVIGLIIQELDADRNVVFEWRSWDHFQFTDSMYRLDTPLVDPVHGNSVEVDYDGNLLLSSRSMDEVTKIDRQTGDIIWRFGGKNNQFTLINDYQFFHAQHDARRLQNGHITLFDNRTDLLGQYSRAVEYELDEVAKTATLVWEYRNTPDIYSAFLSNAQRLPNGNTVVGWGAAKPTMIEVKPNGAKVMELSLPDLASYRAFRFPWQGTPPWAPTLTNRVEDGRTILYYSWNGATNVRYYNIYAGNTPEPAQLVQGVIREGFETSTDITELVDRFCYFRVVPITEDEQPLTPSNVARALSCDGTFLPAISTVN